MNIEGKWKVRYALAQEAPFSNEEGDIEEVGEVVFNNGSVLGNDPHGGVYSGTYSFLNNQIRATVLVSTLEEDSESIFENVAFPFNLELEGEFNTPNRFSMTGKVLENEIHKIILNCERT